ncbi:MAG: potassium transporter TrkG [Clostridiaceae bacterium]|nr:potassium transporter TrkG [Clostridiaceae bacterium]
MKLQIDFHRMTVTRTISLGFAAIILVGAMLLMLPPASRDHQALPFLHALFTSASATCVTGLAIYDTYTQFTFFGQFVILLLIQIGGLGFMTVALQFSLAVGRRIGLRERSLLSESVGSNQVGGVVRMVRRVLYGTLIIEGVGAVLLGLRFVPMLGVVRGIWFAVFHSVSAFCNAGFDLMGIFTPSLSLEYFIGDALVSVTVMGLIIVGGIGFVVWNDLIESEFRYKKLKQHTRVVIFATAVLILAGAGLFYAFEHDAALAELPRGTQILASLFQSVTPRTAGFSVVQVSSMSPGAKLLTMLLMFIGAAPGGTGGGVKITTIVVAIAALVASLRKYEDVTIGSHRVSSDVLWRAFCGILSYALTAFFAMLVLSAQGIEITDAMFECLSALGTVGLSTGVTSGLPALSMIAVILLMYIGRIGSLTVFMAMMRSRGPGKIRNPVGIILIG